jgi:hypothetical protein
MTFFNYDNWFTNYAAARRRQVPARYAEVLDEFDMKTEHTRRVQAYAEEIARWLKLSDDKLRVASLCGLFHDLGRFEQAVFFGTMDDRVTGSHAELGEAVFWRDVPQEGLSTWETEILAEALRCHSLFKLPKHLSGDVLLFSKLIRDADKLDIFQYVISLRTGQEQRLFRHLPHNVAGEPNPMLAAAVLRGDNVDAAMVQNNADRILLEISMIYDLNFGISFKRTLDMRLIEHLTAAGGALPVWGEIAAYTLQYLRERAG